MDLSALALRLRALSVLRGLHRHPLVRAYLEAFDALDQGAAQFADRYGALCAARHLSAYHEINPAKFIVVFTFGYSAKQHMCGIPFQLECTPDP